MDQRSLRIQGADAAELPRVAKLVLRVFDEFVAPGYSAEGVRNFRAYAAAEAITARAATGNLLFTAATTGDKLVGMIEIRNLNHISLLFVDPAFHRRGVARRLLDRALRECLGRNPAFAGFTVHASPYSVPIYGQLGFEAEGPEVEQDGIIYTPMRQHL